MSEALFKNFAQVIERVGNAGPDDEEVNVSDLSLIRDEDGSSILFNLLGSDFLFDSDGTVATIIDEDGTMKSMRLREDVEKSVLQYLNWRAMFLRDYNM